MNPSLPQAYHRKQSRTQTAEVASLQEASGEIWGSYNRDLAGGRSSIPSVDAFVGPLPNDQRGIEFITDVPPDPHTRPKFARWTGPRPGVIIDGDYAKIKVTVTRNNQRG